jgi:hypothetical protein
MRKIFLSAAAALLCISTARAEYCSGQKVTALILNDTSIYFTTDKSCPNWCRVAPGLAEKQQDRMYSMMLTAVSTGRTLTFFFTEAQACEAVPTLSSPTAIIYTSSSN